MSIPLQGFASEFMDTLSPGEVFRIGSFVYEMSGRIAQSVQRLRYELGYRGSILHMDRWTDKQTHRERERDNQISQYHCNK